MLSAFDQTAFMVFDGLGLDFGKGVDFFVLGGSCGEGAGEVEFFCGWGWLDFSEGPPPSEGVGGKGGKTLLIEL
jgi:hypothetical protein